VPLNQKDLEKLLRQLSEDIERLPGPALREIMPVINLAKEETQKAFDAWEIRNPQGDVTRFTRERMRLLLIQLRMIRDEGGRKLLPHPPWLKGIRGAMSGIMTKQLPNIAQMSQKHLLKEMGEIGFAITGQLNPINLDLVALIEKGDKALVPQFKASAARYSGAIWQDMKRQLAIGVTKGETFEEMTKRLQRLGGPKSANAVDGLFRRYKGWASRVVRTEMVNAYNVQHDIAISKAKEADPRIRWRWDASLDSRVCKECQALHGKTRDENETFPGGYKQPPAHPNCFVPDTAIAGEFVGALKSYYSGEVCEIRVASGKRLTVTPNHPILTSAGWVRAADLVQGMYALSYTPWSDRVIAPRFTAPNEQHRPAAICDVFSALRDVSISRLAAPTARDLHGDAAFVKGDIEIVGPTGPFEIMSDSQSSESARDFRDPFSYTGLRDVSGDRPLNFFSLAHDTPTRSVMGVPYLPTPLLCSHARPFKRFRLGLTPKLYTSPLKPEIDSPTADAKFLAELISTNPGSISRDEITDVRFKFYSGHVYDVQTSTGWVVANGIVASNCRCAMLAWREDWENDV
jgi:SPP1 gp7 family putative phage head morphogenesis protein